MAIEQENKRFGKWADYYRTFALIFLNSIILFVLINLGADGILDLKEGLKKRAESRSAGLFGHKKFHPLLKSLYPNMAPKEITELIRESRGVQFGYDPFTQFKELPCSGKYINIDRRGFRKSKAQGPWPIDGNRFNIFVFGGSTTFGYRLRDDQTIPALLQQVMNKGPGPEVKVYNFGRCAYYLSQERALLEKLVLSGAIPHMAIFIDGLNEFVSYDGRPNYTKELSMFMRGDFRCSFKNTLSRLPIIELFGLWNWEKLKQGGLNPPDAYSKAAQENKARVEEEVIKRYLKDTRLCKAICEGFSIIPVFVWQPVAVYRYESQYNIFKDFNYNEFTPYLEPGYRTMAEVIKETKPEGNFIYLADMQEDMKRPLYVDAYHYSANMCFEIASKIHERLREQNPEFVGDHLRSSRITRDSEVGVPMDGDSGTIDP